MPMKKIMFSLASLSLAFSSASAEEDKKIDWEKDVWPFIENSCVECHKAPYTDEKTGRLKKPKADLRYDGKTFILKGGENNDDAPTLTPGDPEKSSMLLRTLIPIDNDPDDEHMPPVDKADQLTDAQKKTLELWIKQGADFGSWVGATE